MPRHGSVPAGVRPEGVRRKEGLPRALFVIPG